MLISNRGTRRTLLMTALLRKLIETLVHWVIPLAYVIKSTFLLPSISMGEWMTEKSVVAFKRAFKRVV